MGGVYGPAVSFAAFDAGAGRLPGGDQLVLAGADQIGAAHALQRVAQHRPVLGIVIAQEGLVQAALLQALGASTTSDAAAPHRAQRVAPE